MTIEQQLDQLLNKVLLLEGRAEQRTKAAELALANAQRSLASVGQSVSGATQDIQRITSTTLGSAIQKPVEKFEQDIANIRNELIQTSNAVQKHVDGAVKPLRQMIWIACTVLALAGIVCLGSAVYVFLQARQEIQKSEWVSSINAAIASGKLTACPEGGMCAVVDKKLVRLNR